MGKLQPTSILKLLPCLTFANPVKATRRHAFSIAWDGRQREAKARGEDEGWQSALKGLEHKPAMEYKGYRRLGSRSHKSRVQTLLERSNRFESVKERFKRSGSAAIDAMRETIDFDDAEKQFPEDVIPMYQLIIEGEEGRAWEIFRQVIAKGQEGEPSASIWHWYIMLGLVARDSTVSIKDVFKMAWHSKKVPFTKSAIYLSLKNPDELGGIIGQQRVLAFTLMHNLRKRTTEEAYRAVLSVWTSMRLRKISPASRHINAMCVTLIHMGRQEEAMSELLKRMKPTSVGPYQEDAYGWMTSKQNEGAQMNQYTVGMLMFAFLTEGFPKRAYEMYKASVSETYTVPIQCVPLNLLLWAGRQSYQGIATCQVPEPDRVDIREPHYSTESKEGLDVKNIAHWRSQAMWDGHPSAIQARHIFKTYLYRSHPELRDAVNPLYESRAGDHNGLLWKTHARMQRWSQSFNDFIAPLVRWESHRANAKLLAVPINDNVPEEETLKFDEITFNYYLNLLPYVSIFEEVPWEEYVLVLAWMKQLDIKPDHYCLLRICWALDHLVPPAAEFASCAGPLHEYLVDWIGEEQIPTRAELEAFERRQRF